MVMLDIFIATDFLVHALSQIGLLLVFYGVYFGVLGRDLSELCTDWMAQTVGVRILLDLFLPSFLHSTSLIHLRFPLHLSPRGLTFVPLSILIRLLLRCRPYHL